jgi:ABC-type multidrug transport system ATPase subunit
MDETEALCTKIGIMVNGELKCIGSLQHLKSRYGEGYTLLAKISKDSITVKKFLEFILESFPNSLLKENRDGFLNIHLVNNKNNSLSKIFSSIETNKKRFNIEYYVVTQTKLEQIFLNFASRQIDPESRYLYKKSKINNNLNKEEEITKF